MIDFKQYWYKWTHPVLAEIRTLHRVTNEVSNNPLYRPYEVTPNVLESLILEYRDRGFHFISMDELMTLVEKKHSFPYVRQKNVVFTIDDGYADNYENAYPIFKKYNIPFCIFVCKQYVTGETPAGEGENYRMLSMEQLLELTKEPLCTIGCHTLSHPELNRLSYNKQLQEISGAKQWLEDTLRIPMLYMAYPYGEYNEESIHVVQQLNFKSAVSSNQRKCRGNQSESYVYQLPRITVVPLMKH